MIDLTLMKGRQMKLTASRPARNLLADFDRTALEQASINLIQALRVLEQIPCYQTNFIPHPITVIRAEIENARRYLKLVAPLTSASLQEADAV
jgi:hypothetical protein